MKTILYSLFWFLLFSSSQLFAQKYQVQALVKTENNPATFYDILLISNDTLATNTDEIGHFTLEAESNNYKFYILMKLCTKIKFN